MAPRRSDESATVSSVLCVLMVLLSTPLLGWSGWPLRGAVAWLTLWTVPLAFVIPLVARLGASRFRTRSIRLLVGGFAGAAAGLLWTVLFVKAQGLVVGVSIGVFAAASTPPFVWIWPCVAALSAVLAVVREARPRHWAVLTLFLAGVSVPTVMAATWTYAAG